MEKSILKEIKALKYFGADINRSAFEEAKNSSIEIVRKHFKESRKNKPKSA